MNIFAEIDNLIEKLINEHGSATILKERILLLKDQHAVLIDKNISYEKEITNLGSKICELENQISDFQIVKQNLELNVNKLKNEVDSFHNSNPDKHACDHCGSGRLKRTGSRPLKKVAGITIKDALYTCDDCGKESAFTIIPK